MERMQLLQDLLEHHPGVRCVNTSAPAAAKQSGRPLKLETGLRHYFPGAKATCEGTQLKGKKKKEKEKVLQRQRVLLQHRK